MSYLDETHAKATIEAGRIVRYHRVPLPRLRLRDRFERFRRGAGHTVIGICRCDLCQLARERARLP